MSPSYIRFNTHHTHMLLYDDMILHVSITPLGYAEDQHVYNNDNNDTTTTTTNNKTNNKYTHYVYVCMYVYISLSLYIYIYTHTHIHTHTAGLWASTRTF